MDERNCESLKSKARDATKCLNEKLTPGVQVDEKSGFSQERKTFTVK